MHYGYDLKNQGDRIEFDAITYNADYFHLTDIDLNFFEATLGPSFNMKRIGWDKTRFYVTGSAMRFCSATINISGRVAAASVS